MEFMGIGVELIGFSLFSTTIAVFYHKGRLSKSKLIQKLYPSNYSLREENEKLKSQLEQARVEINNIQNSKITASSFEDIHQKNHVQDYFSESKNYYKLLSETLPVGIYRSDKAGRLIFVNKAMVDMFGYSSEEQMLEQHCSNFYKHKEDRLSMILEFNQNKILRDYNNTFRRKNGSEFIGTEYCQLQGNELHGVIQDTTEKSKVASEKNDLIHTLKNQTKDFETFAHIISHNLRIPLVNIVGLTEILDKNTLTKNNKEVIDLIIQSTNNLDMIVKDLNKTISIREKEHEHYKKVSFHQLVDEVKTNLSDHIGSSNAYISCSCIDNTEIETIPNFLKNILFQLIDNAIKFRKDSQPPQVNVTLHSDDKNYHITVQDNGIGIDLDVNQNRLFKLYEKFYPEMEGRGVGLYMTYNHVNALKGQINILSQVNTGTKVIITLPKEM